MAPYSVNTLLVERPRERSISMLFIDSPFDVSNGSQSQQKSRFVSHNSVVGVRVLDPGRGSRGTEVEKGTGIVRIGGRGATAENEEAGAEALMKDVAVEAESVEVGIVMTGGAETVEAHMIDGGATIGKHKSLSPSIKL
ncbi:hypothetical protein ANCDUO_14006 [Ancylostoma duodenale]|uniref:Uncharacterized protein n=1 Tax=Ancylostoma duodenale TaxID=51022 RepID=A0A0C2D1D4_9BILA|nr:hypothetical protein ANCDUO_14006 [Ancylostoma duodenale]